MLEYDLIEENNNLKSKLQICQITLQSKNEALDILYNELEVCKKDRDMYESESKNEQEKLKQLKKRYCYMDEKIMKIGLDKIDKGLKSEGQYIEDVNILRKNLTDANGDITYLRLHLKKLEMESKSNSKMHENMKQNSYHNLLPKYEKLKAKFDDICIEKNQLQEDLNEMTSQNDEIMEKYTRLNNYINSIRLNDILSEKDTPVTKTRPLIVDVDYLLVECKYLADKLKCSEEEKKNFQKTISKYKCLVDKRKNNSCGILKIGQPKINDIISHREVKRLLLSACTTHPTPKVVSDLQTLAYSLLEALYDKNTALKHQRKTNKIIATKLQYLEDLLSESLDNHKFKIVIDDSISCKVTQSNNNSFDNDVQVIDFSNTAIENGTSPSSSHS
ncbi:Coiled-coil domain-containing protein [Intoshia linei]|uniref:Coiled-coil domain-containing protein n=1 Tax=Intoshia linei TaxID=1819745 RepID=A0A177ARI7_9BILA|nr:Coiled-coil domain-containing protein [Intoshia linei]